MRRALLLAALAAPALATAQTIATGAIQFTDGTDDIVHGKWISLDECGSDTAEVNLSWNTQLVNVQQFPVQSKYTVYASNKQPSSTTCYTASDQSQNIVAGSVGVTLAGQPQVVNLQPYSTKAFVTTAGFDCTVTADTPIYVCVQAYQSDGVTVIGVAKGTLTLSTAKPAAPPTVNAVPADTGALLISWAAPGGSTLAYDYVIRATATDPAGGDPNSPHDVPDVRALSYTMKGLVVGVTYDIQVWSRSEAGNRSETPGTATGIKSVKVANFWDVYHDAPFSGQDSGGCGTPGAGALALLGVAALLSRLRRRA